MFMKNYINYKKGEYLFDKKELLGLLLQVMVNGKEKTLKDFKPESPISIHYNCITRYGKLIYRASNDGPEEYEEFNDDFDYEPSSDELQEKVLDLIRDYDNETLEIIFDEFDDKADNALIDLVSMFTASFIDAFELEDDIIDEFSDAAEEAAQEEYENDCADAEADAAEAAAEARWEAMLDKYGY